MNKYGFLINITSECNLNCYDCAAGCSPSTPKYYINVLNLETNLKQLKNICQNLTSIIISGGEPLLHPEFLTIVKIIRDIFPDIQIIVFTNGILLSKFDEKDFQFFSEINLLFSVSLYPKESLYLKVIKNCEKLEQYNIITTPYEKSRPLFFKNSYTFEEHQNNKFINFNTCNGRHQDFYTIIENKIFGCDEGIKFTNLNLPIVEKDYIKIENLKNEAQLLSLKNEVHNMCAFCANPYADEGQGFIIWHTQDEIKNNASLLNIFLNDYESYKKLQDNHTRIKKCINNLIFDYGIMKKFKQDGYDRLIKRYYSGQGDICLIFKDKLLFDETQLLEIRNLLLNQKNFSNFNIYICCQNLLEEEQVKIYKNFSPSFNFYNSYIFKENADQDSVKYFFDNSFNKKYFIITANENIFKDLSDQNFLIRHLQEKK